MRAKDFKELINKIDDDVDLSFTAFDEYGTEVEGLKFQSLEKGYGKYYLTLSAAN